MPGFHVDTAAMVRASTRLDEVARDLTRAGADATAVPVAEGAFGRLPESASAHTALQACTERVIRDLERLTAAMTRVADGVIASAHRYSELDRRGAVRLRGSVG